MTLVCVVHDISVDWTLKLDNVDNTQSKLQHWSSAVSRLFGNRNWAQELSAVSQCSKIGLEIHQNMNTSDYGKVRVDEIATWSAASRGKNLRVAPVMMLILYYQCRLQRILF